MRQILLALAALVAISFGAHAQQDDAEKIWTEIEDGAFVVEALGMTVDELDGVALFGRDGERIGELDDVLVEQGGDSVAVSADIGGFLGIGEKDVLIPADALAASATADGIEVDLSDEQLRALAEYED